MQCENYETLLLLVLLFCTMAELAQDFFGKTEQIPVGLLARQGSIDVFGGFRLDAPALFVGGFDTI